MPDVKVSFLEKLQGERVSIYLISGIQLRGILDIPTPPQSIAPHVILKQLPERKGEKDQLIYIHAISTIMPSDATSGHDK
jgi:sRNA-binding regulator protein Hfq